MQFLSQGGTRQKNPHAVISVGIGRNKKSGLWGKGIPFRAVIPWSLHQPITIPHLIKTPCNHSCYPWLDLLTCWLTVSDLPDKDLTYYPAYETRFYWNLWGKGYYSMLKWHRKQEHVIPARSRKYSDLLVIAEQLSTQENVPSLKNNSKTNLQCLRC